MRQRHSLITALLLTVLAVGLGDAVAAQPRAQDAMGREARLAEARGVAQERGRLRHVEARKGWVRGQAGAQVAASVQDSLALDALYRALNGAAWVNNANWGTGPVATWYGVKLNAEGRVTDLLLDDNNLQGVLPEAIGALAALDTLDLIDNALLGHIPDTLGALSNLRFLGLSLNRLAGTLPLALGRITGLRSLRLDNNRLTGTIPDTLSTLSELEDLWLWNNLLTGTLPPSLGNLGSLRRLYLDFNQFTGPIPESFGDLQAMTDFFADFNQLSGEIPAVLGTIPRLRALFLGSNRFTGPIPEALGDLALLEDLSLSFNGLTGTIPEALYDLQNLYTFFASDNFLGGPLPRELAAWPLITKIYLAGNAFSGPIPVELTFIVNLVELDLSDNVLTGTIPPSLAGMRILRKLVLSNNPLDDAFPFALPGSLRELRLANIGYTGPLPEVLINHPRIQTLDLENNAFSGPIPSWLNTIRSMFVLDLSGNQLSGDIPDMFARFPFLGAIDFGDNALTGTLPPSLLSLPRLSILDVGGNQLSGPLPDALGQATGLTFLHLDGNAFTGAVPASLNNLTALVSLLIDDNDLDTLPPLTGLSGLDTASVRLNRFTFEDFEINGFLLSSAYTYAPQDTVATVVDRGASDITFSVQVGGITNTYQWYLEGQAVPGETTPSYTRPVSEAANVERVHAVVSNAVVPLLQIVSEPARTDAELATIHVTPDTVTVAAGAEAVFTAEGRDSAGAVLVFPPRWSATGGTIDAQGRYRAGSAAGTYAVRVTDRQGAVTGEAVVTITTGTATEATPAELADYALHANYPNPFNPETRIAFDVKAAGPVRLAVYDVLGREVAVLVDRTLPAGRHDVAFQSGDLPSGLYLYRIVMGPYRASRTMVLVK